MKLLALSGGVDSMVLAHLYKDEPDLILAFVNYNFRPDTAIDKALVTAFATTHNLKLEVLELDGTKPRGNLQAWARTIRYEFFATLYQRYGCTELLVGHHKDDLLETCLMQAQRNPLKLFYGLAPQQQLFAMNVVRPLLEHFWKHELYAYAARHQLRFHEDFTNFEDHYQRNYIRNRYLKGLDPVVKQHLLDRFAAHNRRHAHQRQVVADEFQAWHAANFNLDVFKAVTNPEALLVQFVNCHVKPVNLNRHIIANLLTFVRSRHSHKGFLLSGRYQIRKVNNHLQVVTPS